MSADGVLLVDKPAGPTSHDVVAWTRRALSTRRVGHAGTLDPFATGLLVTCIGRATRLARFVMASPKIYEGRARFGVATDTLDATGTPEAEPVPVRLEREALEAAIRTLTGEIDQVPPMYSAKKQGGVPLHRLARRGEEVVRAPVRVHVDDWEVLELEADSLRFRVRCSPGTYVRVLAADLGALLDVPAHLETLRRVASGPFDVADAVDGETLCGDAGGDAARERLIPLDELPDLLPVVRLSDAAARRAFANGQAPRVPEAPDPGTEVFVRTHDGRLAGVGRVDGARVVRPVVVLLDSGD